MLEIVCYGIHIFVETQGPCLKSLVTQRKETKWQLKVALDCYE